MATEHDFIKAWLNEYRDAEKGLRRLERHISCLREDACNIKASANNRMDKNGFSDIVNKMVDLEGVYTRKWDRLIDLRIEIEKAIEILPIVEQTLIQLKYIEGCSWKEVCLKLGYEWAQTHRIHIRALRKLEGQRAKDDMK